MSLSREIAYNTLLQIIAKVVGTLFAVIAFGLMARYLGAEGFGAYATITAYLQLFGILVDMGLTVITIQMISEAGADHRKNFHNLFTLRLLSGIVIYLLAPLIVLLFPYPAAVKLGVAIMAPSFFLSSLIQISTARYQAHVTMSAPVIAEIISKLILIGGIVVAIALDWGLPGILAMILINNGIQWLILVLWNNHWHWLRLAFDRDVWREIFRRTWPIALSILCNVVYLRADTVILSLFRSQEEVGLYGAAFRVLEVAMTLPVLFIGLTLASFTRAWSRDDRTAFSRYFQKSFDVMAISAFPLIVGTWFVGVEMMVFITGASFSESGEILKLLMIAVGPIFFGSLFGHLINIIHAQRRMLVGYACVAVAGLVAYLVFIPAYSYWAAATITITTELAIGMIGFAVFFTTTRIVPSLARACKALASSVIMGIFLYAFPGWPVVGKIFGAMGIYIVALFITGGLTKELVYSLLPKNKTASLPR